MKTPSTFRCSSLVSLALMAIAGPRFEGHPVANTAALADDCCSAEEGELQNVYVQAPVPGTVSGTVSGRVLFEGKLPPKKDLVIPEAQSKGCTNDGSKVSAENHTLLIGPDKGIANAVVTIAAPGQSLRVPKTPVLLDQVQCRFDQHVVVVPAGTTLEYKNSDAVPHNVHTFARKNTAINRTLTANASYEQVVSKAEAIRIACDFHPWMRSYVFVADTNYAALTDASGYFSIPGLPPGEYTAKVWHESLGKTEIQIKVDEKGVSEAVEIPMKAKKSKRGR